MIEVPVKGEDKTFKFNAKDLLVGPDTIFCGRVKLLDANIFKAETYSGIVTSTANMTGTIKIAIAKMYVTLRNLCAMIMLGGLIFTGIRILVSSNVPTKMAQWRAYLQDWLIGLILLIFSHILMNGVFYISDSLVNIFRENIVEGRNELDAHPRVC